MGFVSDTNGAAEKLYVVENRLQQPPKLPSKGLATIDTVTFGLNVIGPFSPPIFGAELTGTGDGRLFGFFTKETSGSRIIEIDKLSASVVAGNDLPVGTPNDAFAFAFWGGDFYVFTGTTGGTGVTRFRPSDGSSANLTNHPQTIVGAGVSTCAPQ